MSINEADLPASRRFNIETTVPFGHVTTTSLSTELPAGSRKFNATVAFPQSRVTTGQSEDIEFVSGPKGDKGDKGDTGDDAQWQKMTMAEFAALPVKDPNTLYVIIG